MNDDASPENLRKFLESDDPAMVLMGLSMAKGIEVSGDMLADVLWMYMFHKKKLIRAVAKSTFMNLAPENVKKIVKENWRAEYRKRTGLSTKLLKLEKNLSRTTVSLVQPLITALGSWPSGARIAAAVTLDGLGWKPDTNEIRVTYLIAKQQWEAVAKLGGVEPLIKALEDEGRDVRWHAARALEEIGEPAVEPLITALGDAARRVRAATAEVLGNIGDERAVEPLSKALDDSDFFVRWGVADALGQIGDARAVEPLITALGDEERHIRRNVAGALGKIGDARAVESLITALGDEDEWVRNDTAEALGKIGDARAVEPLIEALGDEEDKVRWSAMGALGQIGDVRAVKPLTKALRDGNSPGDSTASHAAWALGGIGEPAIEPLITALGNEDISVRSAAADALGQIGDPCAVEPLIEVLSDGGIYLQLADDAAHAPRRLIIGDDPWIRRSAAMALGQIGNARAVEPLNTALGDEDESVRWAAAKALGQIGGARVVELLTKALGDEKSSVRSTAAKALGQISDSRAVESLITSLNDDDHGVSKAAAEALGRIQDKVGSARMVKILIKVLGDDDANVRQAANRVLTTKLLKAVLAEMDMPTSGTKKVLIQRLQEVG